MNVVSACCGSGIEQGSVREYPLGGTVWYESFIVDVCGACGKEAEPVHTCGNCGAELNGDNPEVIIENDEKCHICLGIKEEALAWQ